MAHTPHSLNNRAASTWPPEDRTCPLAPTSRSAPRLATVLALAATLTAPAAVAAPLTFPGCGATLQACVDAAASGDTVELGH